MQVNGFWDCKCKVNYIRPATTAVCEKCGAVADEQPNSNANELAALPLTAGIYVARTPDGSVMTNVPYRVVHHSPDGFEFGYGGSGPADLALSIVEAVLRRHTRGWLGQETRCYRGECFSTAWQLHQDFKQQFIVGLDQQNGGVFPLWFVQGWIERKLKESPQVHLGIYTDGHDRLVFITDASLEYLNEKARQATDGEWWWEAMEENQATDA